MNSDANLLERLLKLYPVRIVKNNFEVDSTTQNEIVPEIVERYTPRLITDFAIDNIDNTKQHIYFYRLDRPFSVREIDLSTFPFEIKRQTHDARGLTFVIFPIVEFDVVLSAPFEGITINFCQPTIVSLTGQNLIIRTTILEKNIKYYFPLSRRALTFGKRNSEVDFIKSIVNFFEQSYRVEVCDINRGIKKLWDDDSIDSKHVKWKKSRSTTTEAMDEEFTLKTQYPEVYQTLIHAPLGRTIFKYLLEDDNLCKHFTADPTLGQLSIATFPDNQNQVRNVIHEILTNN